MTGRPEGFPHPEPGEDAVGFALRHHDPNPPKPHPWWRKALVAICRFIPWCDGDEVFGVRGRDEHRS